MAQDRTTMKESYSKHYVKRDPSNQKMIFNEGKAEKGDFIRKVTLTEQTANQLNSQSRQHGFVWIKNEDDSKNKSIYFKSKDDLVQLCKDKGLSTEGNKPDLIARLEEYEKVQQ